MASAQQPGRASKAKALASQAVSKYSRRSEPTTAKEADPINQAAIDG
jgi:hypothetical protein